MTKKSSGNMNKEGVVCHFDNVTQKEMYASAV